jgi:hypothetical protein
MPEVKRSPATPDKSLSRSLCNLANRVLKIYAPRGCIRDDCRPEARTEELSKQEES